MIKPNRKKIIGFIKTVQRSFHDSYIAYSFGGCYGFYEILKYIFPNAQPYFDKKEKNHIITKIGEDFYDINGLVDTHDKGIETIRLTEREKEYWENAAFGQRFEWMLAKYNSNCKLKSENKT